MGDRRLGRQAALDQPRRRRRLHHRRPRRRGRRIWAGASPAPGTAPERCPAARRRPRRSCAARPCSRGRLCPRCRRWSRCAADGPAARRDCAGAGARASARSAERLSSRRRGAGLGLLDILQRQQHLIFGQRLGAAAEAMALHLLDDLSAAARCAPARQAASP